MRKSALFGALVCLISLGSAIPGWGTPAGTSQRGPRLTARGAKPQGRTTITRAEAKAVTQAIEDEIYALKLAGYYGDLGVPTRGSAHRLTAYVQPLLTDGRGWVIYKLMPYGQVIRMFYLRKDGLAVLHGDPKNGFPPTQPDYLTVYMSDDELCKLEHTWLKFHYTVDPSPSHERVRLALARQRKRRK